MKKSEYLLFCETCGTPKHIPKYIIANYWTLGQFKAEYCRNCGSSTEIPKHLKTIAKELLK